MCMFVSIWEYTYACAYKGQRKILSAISQTSSSIFIETVTPGGLELLQVGLIGRSKPQGSTWLCVPRTGITMTHHHTEILLRVHPGNQTQVPLTRQARYQWAHLPSTDIMHHSRINRLSRLWGEEYLHA